MMNQVCTLSSWSLCSTFGVQFMQVTNYSPCGRYFSTVNKKLYVNIDYDDDDAGQCSAGRQLVAILGGEQDRDVQYSPGQWQTSELCMHHSEYSSSLFIPKIHSMRTLFKRRFHSQEPYRHLLYNRRVRSRSNETAGGKQASENNGNR